LTTAAAQAGLNGVDNGQLWFYNVRVGRDALLDRYASVAPDGTYTSPIPSVAQRFGTMVGGLTTGAHTRPCCRSQGE
jgi:acyl-CoA oxidase